MRLARHLLVLCGLIAAPFVAAQTTFTWTGSGGDNDVFNGANWQGGIAPTGDPADSLFFPEISADATSDVYPTISGPFAVKNLTFATTHGGYFLYGDDVLTLHGDIDVYSYAGIITSLSLAAGNHVIFTDLNGDAGVYGSLGIYYAISGPGGLTKEGDGYLTLSSANSYGGGTTINAGTVQVGADSALSYGTVAFNAGEISAVGSSNLTLGNDFVLGSNLTFSNYSDGVLYVGNGDGSSITPAAGVSNVNLNLAGPGLVYLQGNLQDGTGPTTYTFAGNSWENGAFVLGAVNTYTGGTVVTDGAKVLFDTSSAVPATGLITIDSGGYAGLQTTSVATSTFLSRINPVDTWGTIGFDGGLTFTGDIDLSGFVQSESVTLGTRSTATLTGVITPAAGTGGGYNFLSNGKIFLEGTNPLSGSFALTSSSNPDESPGWVVLNQSVPNTYTNGTIVNGGAVVFDSPGSLPATGGISLYNSGYVSFTETSGLTLDDLVARVQAQAGDASVLGIDDHNFVHFGSSSSLVYSDNIDLGSLPDPVYVGTSSYITLTGNLTTTSNDNDDYYLTGYNGGFLFVDSLLTGSHALYAGAPGDLNSYSGVELTNAANDFTGGIVLSSGNLFAAAPQSLGSGPITVEPSSYSGYAGLITAGTLPNDIHLSWGTLTLAPYDNPLTLTGTVSGYGSLHWESVQSGQLTLAGVNTYSGGSVFGSLSPVTAASDFALGTGSVTLRDGAAVHFTTASPVIGSLVEGSAYVDNTDGYVQVDAALVGAAGGAQTLTISQTEDGYFDGAILEDGTTLALVKNGSETLTIGGSNYDNNNPYPVYSGGTTINAGKLVAGSASALGSGAIVLNGGSLGTTAGVTLSNPISFGAGGGTLAGNGTFATPITAGPNVVLAPGNSPGTLTFTSGLTLGPGGTLDFEVQTAAGAAGTGYDLVNVSGGLLDITATSGSPFTINLLSLDSLGSAGLVADFSSGSGYSWMLFAGNSVGGINGFSADKFALDLSGFSNDLAGGTFSFSQGTSGGNPAIFLSFSPVPEPSTWALLGAGLIGGILARRKRR